MSILSVEPGKTRIGWIGTGVMGSSMCAHLIDRRYSLTVSTRTRRKAQTLLDRGAAWADSPREVAAQSDVVFAIVGFPHDVREVFLDPDQGVLAGATAGNVIVDMTTSEPSLAIEIFQAARQQDVHALDAPVSGGDSGARSASLSIMIGGDADVVAALQPCFDALGKTIVHQGPAGAGQHTKMVNQTLIATGMIGVCEASCMDIERVWICPRSSSPLVRGRRAAGRFRTWGRASSTMISTPASLWNTSSKIWGSRLGESQAGTVDARPGVGRATVPIGASSRLGARRNAGPSTPPWPRCRDSTGKEGSG